MAAMRSGDQSGCFFGLSSLAGAAISAGGGTNKGTRSRGRNQAKGLANVRIIFL
jgi:hypothetical protein